MERFSADWVEAECLLSDAEQLSHFLVLESLAGNVWLDPLIVDDKLWNRPLAGLADHFFRGSRRLFDVDLVKGNVVLGQPTLGGMAVPAPWSRIDRKFHIDVYKY